MIYLNLYYKSSIQSHLHGMSQKVLLHPSSKMLFLSLALLSFLAMCKKDNICLNDKMLLYEKSLCRITRTDDFSVCENQSDL